MSTDTGPGPALRAEGVAVARAGRRIVAELDLELRRGEITALLGPNGAGKSTLLAALASLLPLEAGSIHTSGRVAAASQVPALARRSVRANVEAALAWWGIPRAERTRSAEAALSMLGVAALAERQSGALSGGEARRVHLARALALGAEVLLLDEPFSGLDAPSKADLMHDLASLLRARRSAALIVVHDRAEALAIADRLVVMIDGRKVAEGDPVKLFEVPPSIAVAEFLGYSGRLDEGGAILMTRPGQVALDPAGPIEGRVRRVLAVEDGSRVEIATPTGTLIAAGPLLPPGAGEVVRVRIEGGVRFARARGERAPAGDAEAIA